MIAPMQPRRYPARGLTLLELAMTIVLLGILMRYATTRMADPALLNMPQQAQTAADLVRQAQSLAMSRGQRMGIEVVATSATAVPPVAGNFKLVACTGIGLGTCTTEGTLDVMSLVQLPSTAALYFNSLGVPLIVSGSILTPAITARTFALRFTPTGGTGTHVYTVNVAPLTGNVSVTESHP